MKVLVCSTPGVLEMTTRDMPAERPGHTIVQIRYVCVCGTDLHAFEGTQPYFQYPRVLGHELSATIPATGEAVTIMPYINCEHCIACRSGKPNCCENIQVMGVHTDGGMAPYLSVPDRLIIRDTGLSGLELAMTEPLAIGAHGIRRAQVQAGEFVLVMGAGPIGLGAMAFAAIQGAKVIALDQNPQRLQFAKEKLNIQHTLPAAAGDIPAQLKAITGGDMPTVLIDATGNRQVINNGIHYLAHGGRYVLIGLQKGELVFAHPEFHKRETTLMSSRNATREDFNQVISCIRNGSIRPLDFISREVDFNEVPNAFPGWLDPASGLIKVAIKMEA